MFYIIVALWIAVCVLHCLASPNGKQKLKDLMK
jgi:hypothetical protein